MRHTHHLVAVLALSLAGCATQQQLVEVKVPIPVECREPMPSRPAMATDALGQGVSLTGRVQALLAEIEQREGYEVRLVAALQACTRPIGP